METKTSLALFSLFVFLAGCTSLQTGGEVQSGRQALLEGRNEAALGYFYSAAQKGSRLRLCNWELSETGCVELCRTLRISYRQISGSEEKLGTGDCIQSTRRYRQALFRSDLGSRRRSTARLKRNRKRDARH